LDAYDAEFAQRVGLKTFFPTLGWKLMAQNIMTHDICLLALHA
jgi:hypothetical protein